MRVFDKTGNAAEIIMIDRYGIDWSNDFFGAGGIKYNEIALAYEVEDVEYLKEMVDDYQNGVGDFIDCGKSDDTIVITDISDDPDILEALKK